MLVYTYAIQTLFRSQDSTFTSAHPKILTPQNSSQAASMQLPHCQNLPWRVAEACQVLVHTNVSCMAHFKVTCPPNAEKKKYQPCDTASCLPSLPSMHRTTQATALAQYAQAACCMQDTKQTKTTPMLSSTVTKLCFMNSCLLIAVP